MINLLPEQTCQAPFPPGCKVICYDEGKFHVGRVKDVKISNILFTCANEGTFETYYEVENKESTLCFNPHNMRFTPGTPVNIASDYFSSVNSGFQPGDNFPTSLPGILLGSFEIPCAKCCNKTRANDLNNGFNQRSYFYSVLVNFDSDELAIEEHGIPSKYVAFRFIEAEGEEVNIYNTIHKQYPLQHSHGVNPSPPILARENTIQNHVKDNESEHLDLDSVTCIASRPNHPKKTVTFRLDEAEGEEVNIYNTIHKQYSSQHSHGVNPLSPPILARENTMQHHVKDNESEHLDLDSITSIVSHPNHPKKTMTFRLNEAEGEGLNNNSEIHNQYPLQHSHGVHPPSHPIIARENAMQDRFQDKESEHLDLDSITSIVSHPNHPKRTVTFRLNEAEGEGLNINNEIHNQHPLQHFHGVHPPSPPIIVRESTVEDVFKDEDVDIEREHLETDSIKSLVSNASYEQELEKSVTSLVYTNSHKNKSKLMNDFPEIKVPCFNEKEIDHSFHKVNQVGGEKFNKIVTQPKASNGQYQDKDQTKVQTYLREQCFSDELSEGKYQTLVLSNSSNTVSNKEYDGMSSTREELFMQIENFKEKVSRSGYQKFLKNEIIPQSNFREYGDPDSIEQSIDDGQSTMVSENVFVFGKNSRDAVVDDLNISYSDQSSMNKVDHFNENIYDIDISFSDHRSVDEIDNLHINENIDDTHISYSDKSLDEDDNLNIHKKEKATTYDETVISRNSSWNEQSFDKTALQIVRTQSKNKEHYSQEYPQDKCHHYVKNESRWSPPFTERSTVVSEDRFMLNNDTRDVDSANGCIRDQPEDDSGDKLESFNTKYYTNTTAFIPSSSNHIELNHDFGEKELQSICSNEHLSNKSDYLDCYITNKDDDLEENNGEKLMVNTVVTYGCYFMYDPESGGRLYLHYSRSMIKGAIGFFSPGKGKTIPSFKFKQNFGKFDLINKTSGGDSKKKKYCNGWCQYIKAAKFFDGMMRNNSNYGGLEVDIYFYYLDECKIIQIKIDEMADVSEVDAVACIPKNNPCFNGIKTCELISFLNSGNLIGSSLIISNRLSI